ncbi:Chromo-like domain superfamily [Sesbania bispinosa]|nr:Chromo-like domain superfamily [Sesbania bispinosa]
MAPLPLEAMDHQPIIQPLVILDHKLDDSSDPPRPMVLVQWLGLSPDDTSWEDWDDLQHTFHLEDKVFSYGERNSSSPTVPSVIELMDESITEGSAEEPITERPKRTIVKPKKLEDYVH